MVSKETQAAIIVALLRNPNATQVAKQFIDVSYYTVRRIAKKENIELTAGKAARGPRRWLPPIPQERQEAIITALRENPNSADVAKQIGNVSQTSVWDIATKASIELTAGKAARGWLPISPEKRAAIIAALKDNPHASTRKVAQQVGDVSHETVRQVAIAERRRANQPNVSHPSRCDPS